MTSIYNVQFYGNILVVGRTGCRKTTFEKLGLNKFFGDIKTQWISGIDIDKTKTEIESHFSNETEVHIAKEQDELDSLIETFKLRSREELNDNHDNVINSFGENKKLDGLIIMDDVSGVADISKKSANFLTVSRKFGYICVYVFHVINLSSQIWQKVISQTKSFNIFPASVPYNTVAKILQINCILQSKNMFLHAHFV